MIKKLIIITVALILACPMAYAVEVGGVNLPETLLVGNDTVQLNGGGIREKWFFNVYAGGLYLKNKTNDPNTVIKSADPMAIRLHIISGMITSQKMISATMEGFENAANGNMAQYKDQIDKFLSFFQDEIKKNDIYDIMSVPGQGIVAYKNGKKLGTIPGQSFKELVYKIWLGDKPAQESLKNEMLGLK